MLHINKKKRKTNLLMSIKLLSYTDDVTIAHNRECVLFFKTFIFEIRKDFFVIENRLNELD